MPTPAAEPSQPPPWCRPPGAGFAFRMAPASIPLVLGLRTDAGPTLLLDAGSNPAAPPDEDSWGMQLWRSPADPAAEQRQHFELFQPLPALLDFGFVKRKPYHSRDISIPAMVGRFVVDNRLGSRPCEGFVRLAEPGWSRLQRHEPGTIGWGKGFTGVAAAFEPSARAQDGLALRAIEAESSEPGVGFVFEVPVGARRELLLAFGSHNHPAAGTDHAPWSRAFFGGIEDVLEQALVDEGRFSFAARQQHNAFLELERDPELSKQDLALVRSAVRNPHAQPVLLRGHPDHPERPRVAFIGPAGRINELGPALEHQFLNLALHPWVMRSMLEDQLETSSLSASDASHWLILAASTAAASRRHNWLSETKGGTEALAAFVAQLKSDAGPSSPTRWNAALGAAMLADGLGQHEDATRHRQLAVDLVQHTAEPPSTEDLLLLWTTALYWQHLGTPVDLAPFDCWQALINAAGYHSFHDCCRALGERGGALGILRLGDRPVG